MDIVKALRALRRYKFTFVGVSALAFMLVLLAPAAKSNEPVIYESTAKILLTPPEAGGQVSAYGGSSAKITSSQSWFADATVLKELLTSEELLTRVLTNLGSKESWVQLRERIVVEPLSGGFRGGDGVQLFELVVSSEDPKDSEKTTRLITEEFSSYVQEISAREFASTRKFIEELVAEAEQRRGDAEEKMMLVRQKYLDQPSDEILEVEQRDLENQRQELDREVATLQGQLYSVQDYLEGRTANPPWAVLEKTDSTVAALEKSVAEHKVELARLQEIYTDSNEQVIAARKRLENAERMYRDGLNGYVNSLANSMDAELRQKASRYQSVAGQLNTLLSNRMTPEDRRQLQKLERETQLWEENHLSLLQQLYQARVVEQSSRRQGAVNVLENPRLGEVPKDKKKTGEVQKMAMALPFCLILGGLAALLRDHLSTSMRLRPRIEEALEIPVIAVIPSTPSELTIEWERFKRPITSAAPVEELALARKGHGTEAAVATLPAKKPGGYTNGHGNGHPKGNGHGYSNGHGNGHTNGKNGHGGNGYSNGHGSNGHSNGEGPKDGGSDGAL